MSSISLNFAQLALTLVGRPNGEKLAFIQAKATHFQTMMTTVDEVYNDKTKVPDKFVFRSVSLVCFTADVNVSLVLKLCMQTNNSVCVFMFQSVILFYSVIFLVQP